MMREPAETVSVRLAEQQILLFRGWSADLKCIAELEREIKELHGDLLRAGERYNKLWAETHPNEGPETAA